MWVKPFDGGKTVQNAVAGPVVVDCKYRAAVPAAVPRAAEVVVEASVLCHAEELLAISCAVERAQWLHSIT